MLPKTNPKWPFAPLACADTLPRHSIFSLPVGEAGPKGKGTMGWPIFPFPSSSLFSVLSGWPIMAGEMGENNTSKERFERASPSSVPLKCNAPSMLEASPCWNEMYGPSGLSVATLHSQLYSLWVQQTPMFPRGTIILHSYDVANTMGSLCGPEKANMCITHLFPDRAHAPLSHQTSFNKQKFKRITIQSIKAMTAEYQIQCVEFFRTQGLVWLHRSRLDWPRVKWGRLSLYFSNSLWNTW